MNMESNVKPARHENIPCCKTHPYMKSIQFQIENKPYLCRFCSLYCLQYLQNCPWHTKNHRRGPQKRMDTAMQTHTSNLNGLMYRINLRSSSGLFKITTDWSWKNGLVKSTTVSLLAVIEKHTGAKSIVWKNINHVDIIITFGFYTLYVLRTMMVLRTKR